MRTCAFLSFRLGLPDGVSIVAGSWRRCLERMGWRTLTVAGEGPVDRTVNWLAIDANSKPVRQDLEVALANVDVVVVENALTIPLNLEASRVVAETLRGRAAVLHHHDPPWQRPRFANITELPPTDPAWVHVTINRLTELQFRQRGIFPTTTILNGFNVPAVPGDRPGTRSKLGLADGAVLVAHPVRAIERKNVPAAVALAEQLGATYWLTGQAEEGYSQELSEILANAQCPVIHRSVAEVGVTIADLYAAADLISFPSTWEGFGNPIVEAALHWRPSAVADYPVLSELRELGLQWLEIDDLEAIRAELAAPNQERLDANRRVAAAKLGMEALQARLQDLFDRAGWVP